MFLVISCSSLKDSTKINHQEEFKITKHKARNGLTYINLKCFDFYDKEAPSAATFDVNGIYFDAQKNNEVTLEVNPLDRKYSIEVFSMRKNTVRISNLVVENGDSLAIKIYIKDDMRPIND